MKTIKVSYLKNETRRLEIISTILITFFTLIILRLFYLNVFMGNYYDMLLYKTAEKTITLESAPRGRILDRNGKVLVDNKKIKTIYYQKPNGITTNEEIDLAYQISAILNIDYKSIDTDSLKKFYYLINKDKVDSLITKKEYENHKNRKVSDEEIYNMKINRITNEMLKELDEEDKKSAYIYYLMNKGYSYEDKIIKGKNVTDKEYAYFLEKKIKGFKTKYTYERNYPYGDTLRNILGSISSIPKEEKDDYLKNGYSLNDVVGVSGLEKYYEDLLKGKKATYKLEGNDKVLVTKEEKGLDLVLSIDIELQQKIDDMLETELLRAKSDVNTKYFNKSYVVITNPNNGEIFSMSGKKIISKTGYEAYDDNEGVLLNTVTPGSVVKGASIMVGYDTGAIDIGTYMYDSCIYLKALEKCSWKTLGYINDLDALAYSSNVYQFKTAMKVGGFDYAPGKTLKINEKAFDTYRNMFYRFGLGVKTGIDYPVEESGYTSSNKSGDLLINFSIGQYDTYTTMQLSQYISTIATSGNRYKPHFLKSVKKDKETLYEIKPVLLNTLDVDKKYIDRVRQGFRKVMTSGTGIGYIDEKYSPSGKTGTSESFLDITGDNVIDIGTISNNFVGYAPSDKPIMAISASFPDIQYPASSKYKSNANQIIVKKATDIYFSIYDKNGKKM